MLIVLEKRELKKYVSGKNVLIVSTERNFCEYTYEVLLEVGRYARKQEMIESSCKSALMRKLWIRARLAFRNRSDIDVIVVCEGEGIRVMQL